MLKPGTLWAAARAKTAHALQCGALQSMPTSWEFVGQGGVDFVVWKLSGRGLKEEARRAQDREEEISGKLVDPFLPYDEDLFVADLSDTHLCLLNKFNVLPHHLLIVTRLFEDQRSPLTRPDFEALWACMAEFEGLGFYNGGSISGASQQHKHLQMIPMPLAPEGPRIPIEPMLEGARSPDLVGKIPALPFAHAFTWLDPGRMASPREAAELTLARYGTMLDAVGLQAGDPAYNLLVTRQWMLLVRRSREGNGAISVNALGFAGSLLVRDDEHLKQLKGLGPMTLLQQVGMSIEAA